MKLPAKYKALSAAERRKARGLYVLAQSNLCWHCGLPLDEEPTAIMDEFPVNKSLFPGGFFNWLMHLHHCHKTGMTLGVVHCYCNAVLWEYHGE